jgi:hypothetical protein
MDKETTMVMEMTMTNDKTEVAEAFRAASKHRQQPPVQPESTISF